MRQDAHLGYMIFSSHPIAIGTSCPVTFSYTNLVPSILQRYVQSLVAKECPDIIQLVTIAETKLNSNHCLATSIYINKL